MKRSRLILIYPHTGISGTLVLHHPLSLLYAAVDSIKSGFEVECLDIRLTPRDWKSEILKSLNENALMVGISVMTGMPILSALQISRFIKEINPEIKIAWGGPHVTFNAEQVLQEESVDYAIKGYGSMPMALLAKHLRGDRDAVGLSAISGLAYKDGDLVIESPSKNNFEFIHYKDIPYDLIAPNLSKYGQFGADDRIFSMYSAMGCPYRCSFCSSPAQYKNFPQKYVSLDPAYVADHIQHVYSRYGATYVYFIDDDSFVSPAHVKNVIEEISRRGINVKLGFRGARIGELKSMSDRFISTLAAAGTDILHIGAESGSQRMLDLMRKGCTVEDILEVNRKLARHPEIKAAYNWVIGLPTETEDDLRRTCSLIVKLTTDNPNAITFIPNKFRPIPGTDLFELAQKHGYKPPVQLEDWTEIEAESDYKAPWYTKKSLKIMRMMQLTSCFVDGKLNKIRTRNNLLYAMAKIAARIYRPVATFRLKHAFTSFLFEYLVFKVAQPVLRFFFRLRGTTGAA